MTATRRIASVRIHVERAIERLKNYRILHFIPSSLCPIAEHMVNACAFLTQFMEPLVPPPAPEQANTRASASVAQLVRSMTDTDPCSLPPESFAPVNLMEEEVCRAMDESDSHVAAATEAPVINLDTSSHLPQPCFSCGIADHCLLRQCPLCARRFHHMCQNDDDEMAVFAILVMLVHDDSMVLLARPRPYACVCVIFLQISFAVVLPDMSIFWFGVVHVRKQRIHYQKLC